MQPRQYVAGSLDDENADDNSNVIVGVGGAVLGLLVVGLGVTALTSLGGGNIVCATPESNSAASVALACVSADPFPIMSILLVSLSAGPLL